MRQQIPLIIRSLVIADRQLSKAGFGPISEGGLSLYAGRWVDPITGTIRVTPKASSSAINPTSR